MSSDCLADFPKRIIRASGALSRRRELTAARIRSLGVDMLEFINGENWLPTLMGFFQNRRQRSG